MVHPEQSAVPATHIVAVSRFCAGREVWQTGCAVSAFPRLAGVFRRGRLDCRVSGGLGEMQCPVLHVHIAGEVVGECQRCLEDCAVAVDVERTVYVARDDVEFERLDARGDCEVLPPEAKVDLVALVEDEVLLSLPYALMHEVGKCPETSRAEFFQE